jgi:hypothetical protein|tara:strand:+ start:2722 stop:2907 length:186 start_codon:yes stop_codon:yes gene_type:complete
MLYHFIDEPILFGFKSRHEEIPIGVFHDLSFDDAKTFMTSLRGIEGRWHTVFRGLPENSAR